MITFMRRLVSYWALLIIAALGAYVLLYNQEPIYVVLPGIGQFKVLSAIAFMVCFLLGVSFVSVYFMVDVLKKTLEIRSLRRKNVSLNEQLQRERLKDSPKRTSSDPAVYAAKVTSNTGPSSKNIPAKANKDPFPPEGEIF